MHALSAQLQREYGQGFTKRNLFNIIRSSLIFPDEKIVTALRAQLSWTHFRMDRWSTRTLQARIDSMLFERTAFPKSPMN